MVASQAFSAPLSVAFTAFLVVLLVASQAFSVPRAVASTASLPASFTFSVVVGSAVAGAAVVCATADIPMEASASASVTGRVRTKDVVMKDSFFE
ncbi:hypothetical protein D9M68_997150 [compost metagenome]